MPDSNDIISDPDWYPHDYDPSSDRIQFIYLPEAKRKSLTFLAEASVGDSSTTQWITREQIRTTKFDSMPVHFIFHNAFGRSTLLVKAFDTLADVSGQSEPKILNTLASLPQKDQIKSLLSVILPLLGRPLNNETGVVVKPSNIANALIPHLMNCDTQSKGIIIYGNLRSFLHSVAKKGLQGRIWGRRLMAHNAQHIPLNLGIEGSARFELSDMQAAAIAWLMHQWQFKQTFSQFPQRIRGLESNQFISRKFDALDAGARLFASSSSQSEIAAVCEGEIFATHAKLGGDFTSTVAEQELKAKSEILEEEIEQVAHWIEVIQGQLGFSLPHANPLIR